MYSKDLAIAILKSTSGVTDVSNAEIDNYLQNIIKSFDDIYKNKPFEIAFKQDSIERLSKRGKLIDELKSEIQKLPKRNKPVEKQDSKANFENENNNQYVSSDSLILK